MSFVDMIKENVINEFTGSISVGSILLSILFTFAISIFIIVVYRKTYTGVVYSKSFSLCIILLGMVTSMIIRTITSNLALSLGMVGALSIVRFRTAIKEPLDTTFMFWSITNGIMCGAGIYLIAILASLLIGLFYFLSFMFGFKLKREFLLIIKYKSSSSSDVLKEVNKLKKKKLKTKSIVNDLVEDTYEVELNDNTQILNNLNNINGVLSSSIINYQNDFGA